MPTISEAQQQIAQQRSQLSQAQLQSQQQLRNIESAQSKIPDYSSQKALRQTYAGPTGQVKRSMFQKIKDSLLGQKKQVQQYQQQLQGYEQQVLNPYEQQLKEAAVQQQIQQQAQAQAADYNYALRVYLGQTSGSQIGRVDPSIRVAAQREAEQIESRSYISALNQFGNEQGLKPVIVNGQITGFEDTVKQMSIPIPNIQNLSQQDLTRYEQAGIKFQSQMQDYSLPSATVPGVLDQSKIFDSNQFVANLVKQTGVQPQGIEGYNVFVKPVIDNQQMSRIEQPKDLYLRDSLQSYDTNVPIRKDRGFLGLSSIGNWISDNIIGSSKDFKKGYEKESYSSGLGAFVRASPTGPSGTAYIRQPNAEEQNQMDIITNPITKFIFGNKKSENIWTVNLEDLKSKNKQFINSINKIETINKELESLSKDKININTNEWIGSDEDYNKYVENYNKLENEKQRLQSLGINLEGNDISPTIKAGLFGLTKDVSIQEFNFDNRPLLSTTIVPIKTIGGITEGGLTKLGWEGFTLPEVKTKFEYTKPYGTIEIDPLTGKERVYSMDLITPSTTSFTPKQISTVAELGTGVALYLSPIGTPLFLGGLGEYGIDIGKTLSSGQNLSSSQIQEGLFWGIGTGIGAYQGGKYLFKKIPINIEGGGIAGTESAQIWTSSALKPEIRALEFNVATEEGIKQLQYPTQQYLREPVVARYSTRFREFFGLPELPSKIISPPRVYTDIPLFPFIEDSGTYFARRGTIKGGGFGKATFSAIKGGKEIKLTAEEINNLKVPEFLRSKLTAERYKELGFESKGILPYFAKDNFGLSDLGVLTISKKNIPPIRVDIDTALSRIDINPNMGKINKYKILAKREPLTQIGSIKYFSINQISKDISRGSPRAIGKTFISKGIIVKFPDIPMSELVLENLNPFYKASKEIREIKIIKPNGIKKTPFSKTFGEQLQITNLEQPVIVPTPKSKALTISKESSKPMSKVLEPKTFPPIISTSQIDSSEYIGTGMYERTGGGLSPGAINLQFIPLDYKTNAGYNIRLNINDNLLLSPRETIIELSSPVELSKIGQMPRESLSDITIQRLNESQVTKQNQKLQQQQVTQHNITNIKTPKQRQPRIPRRTFKFPFNFPSQENKKKKLLSKEFGNLQKISFDVYTRVKGKERLIASRVTERAGLDIGAATTLFGGNKASALSASIILKPVKGPARNISTKGEFGKVKDLFRIGKVKGKGASLTLVQKETQRLGTLKERKAIIKARKGGLFI